MNEIIPSRFAPIQPSTKSICLALSLVAALTCFSPAPARAATVTYTGANTTDPNNLLKPGNYSTGALPASGDTVLFNGTAGVNSNLTHVYPGGIAAYGNPGGVSYNVTAGQSGSLTIRPATNDLLLVANPPLTVAAGAGPVTFGSADGSTIQLALAGPANTTQIFTNNSSNTVTFDSFYFSAYNNIGGQTVQFTGSGDFALNASFSGVDFAHAGTGLVTMSHANSSNGRITIGVAQSASVLRATATQALGTGTVFIGQGGASASRLELAGGTTSVSLSNFVSVGARTNTSVAIENVNGNNTLSGGLSVDVGGTTVTVQSDAGNLAVTGPVSGQAGSGKTLVLQGAGNGSISGLINGSLAINKAGTGTWLLSHANNTFSGATVSGGVLEVSANGALGAGNFNVLSTATSLTIDTGVTTPGNGNKGILTLAGGGVPALADVGCIDLTSGANITVYGLVLGTTTEPIGVYSAALFPDYIRGLGTITVAVPEPGTWALLAAGLGGLLGNVVRRRRRAGV